MADLLAVKALHPPPLAGRVAACLIADGADFVSRPVDTLALDFQGIVGDRHAGFTRRAGSREPWYGRGTEIRNNRQVSIVSPDELEEIAAAMAIGEIRPEWIGANLVVAGIPALTMLPPGTVLRFDGGAALFVEGENKPCRIAGGSIGRHRGNEPGFDLAFPKHGRQKRGLVASVERPAPIRQGEAVAVRLPPQRIYGEGRGR